MTSLLAAIDPGKHAGVCVPGVRAWPCRGDRPADVRVAAEWAYLAGVRVAVVERVVILPSERASRKGLVTMAERAGLWLQAFGGLGCEVVRAEPATWQAATGAKARPGEGRASRDRRRITLARAVMHADGTRCEEPVTVDVACAVLMASWYERQQRLAALDAAVEQGRFL